MTGTRITRANPTQTLQDLDYPPIHTATDDDTLAAGYGLYLFTGTDPKTWTLPTPTGNTGAVIPIKNQGSDTLTVSSATGSQIYDTSAETTVDIPPGDSLRLICDGTYWNTI